MVAEEEDRLRLQHLFVGPDELLEEDRRHRRHVLVAEADVGLDEALIAGLHPRHTDRRPARDPSPSAARRSSRRWSSGATRRAGDGGQRLHLPLQPREVVVEQAAVLDDAARDVVGVLGELAERDRLAAADALDQLEVRWR